jgi:hypothetical protein
VDISFRTDGHENSAPAVTWSSGIAQQLSMNEEVCPVGLGLGC